MSISALQSTVTRLQSQLSELRKKDAQEAKKEADALAKVNKAGIEANKSKSLSTIQSKLRSAEAARKDASAAATRRASIAKDITNKNSELMKAQTALSKEEDKQRTKVAKDIQRQQTDQLKRQKEIDNRVIAGMATRRSTEVFVADAVETFDVFISHASEDKEDLVQELADKAKAAGLKVFYDKDAIRWGDSLRARIDHGLANSRFAVVVLSEAFFRKEWPKRELDGIFELEIEGKSRILPIWHKISKDDVLKNAPSLAGKMALTTATLTIDEIVEKLAEIVKS
jgi:TIR domain-containing protein